VVQVDVVIGDVVEIVLTKVELRRLDLFSVGGLPRYVRVRGEILDRVVSGEFHAADEAIAIVERRRMIGAELASRRSGAGLLIVGIDPGVSVLFQQLLLHAQIIN
jgi:hypothetical protein